MRINGDALKYWREQAGHTQTSLSQAAGISQGHISDLESGEKSDVRPTTAKRLADATGRPISDITLADEPQDEVAS